MCSDNWLWRSPLLKGDIWVHYNWLHLREVLQVWVQIDGVEDAESLLSDFRALAGSAAGDLLVEDAAVHSAKENKVLNARNVDAGGQKVHRNSDLRESIVP